MLSNKSGLSLHVSIMGLVVILTHVFVILYCYYSRLLVTNRQVRVMLLRHSILDLKGQVRLSLQWCFSVPLPGGDQRACKPASEDYSCLFHSAFLQFLQPVRA